jgi:hypothetical protein
MVRKRIVIAAAVGACALVLSACGTSASSLKYADNLGPGYVKVGQLYYQVQISRELNPFSDEDRGYLDGLTALQAKLPVGEEWFGVFLQAYNTTNHTITPASQFYITDTLNDRLTPLTNVTPNPYSYEAEGIPAHGQLPSLTSDAWFGPTQGEVLLFKFNYAVLNNRPLILHIVDPADPSVQSKIELDV